MQHCKYNPNLSKPGANRVVVIPGTSHVYIDRHACDSSVHMCHVQTLHVREVFTSEGFLHLNLPKGIRTQKQPQGPNMWLIPPHSAKTVSVGLFWGVSEGSACLERGGPEG